MAGFQKTRLATEVCLYLAHHETYETREIAYKKGSEAVIASQKPESVNDIVVEACPNGTRIREILDAISGRAARACSFTTPSHVEVHSLSDSCMSTITL